MKNFNPRHMRKKFNNKSGSQDSAKSQAFRRAAQWSKQFINQSASALESPRLAFGYSVWSDAARRGNLRKGA